MAVEITELMPHDCADAAALLAKEAPDHPLAKAAVLEVIVRDCPCLSLIAREQGRAVGVLVVARRRGGRYVQHLVTASDQTEGELARELADKAQIKLNCSGVRAFVLEAGDRDELWRRLAWYQTNGQWRDGEDHDAVSIDPTCLEDPAA